MGYTDYPETYRLAPLTHQNGAVQGLVFVLSELASHAILTNGFPSMGRALIERGLRHPHHAPFTPFTSLQSAQKSNGFGFRNGIKARWQHHRLYLEVQFPRNDYVTGYSAACNLNWILRTLTNVMKDASGTDSFREHLHHQLFTIQTPLPTLFSEIDYGIQLIVSATVATALLAHPCHFPKAVTLMHLTHDHLGLKRYDHSDIYTDSDGRLEINDGGLARLGTTNDHFPCPTGYQLLSVDCTTPCQQLTLMAGLAGVWQELRCW